MSVRAIGLLSGGLDSILAAEVVREQGIEVELLNFVGPFVTGRQSGRMRHLATEIAKNRGYKLHVKGLGRSFMQLVERPEFGHGRGMNPCIDCKIYMLKQAAALCSQVGAAFVFTGEVLGQRPMSQHLQALQIIERKSGLEDILLRPLSAKLLKETRPEREGWVDRNRFPVLQGRNRKIQFEMARQRGIELFSNPAGGCLLTDPIMSRRLKDLFRYWPNYDMSDVRLLTMGRHFRIHAGLKAIVGRDEAENRRLENLGTRALKVEWVDEAGPLLLAYGSLGEGDSDHLAKILRFYSKKITPNIKAQVRFWNQAESTETWFVDPATEEELEHWRI